MKKYHTVNYKEFGKRVAARRTELHLTQAAIAERLDCTESYISKIENGKAQPSVDFLVSLANALEIGTDQLLSETKAGRLIASMELQNEWENCSLEVLTFLKYIKEEAKRFEKNVSAKTNSNWQRGD